MTHNEAQNWLANDTLKLTVGGSRSIGSHSDFSIGIQRAFDHDERCCLHALWMIGTLKRCPGDASILHAYHFMVRWRQSDFKGFRIWRKVFDCLNRELTKLLRWKRAVALLVCNLLHRSGDSVRIASCKAHGSESCRGNIRCKRTKRRETKHFPVSKIRWMMLWQVGDTIMHSCINLSQNLVVFISSSVEGNAHRICIVTEPPLGRGTFQKRVTSFLKRPPLLCVQQ